MEFLDYRVILYFKNTPVSIILKNDKFFSNYDRTLFEEIVRHDLLNMTDLETRNAYEFLKEFHDDSIEGNGLNVYNALSGVATKYLTIRDNLPVCRYNDILEWRKLVENVGEDLLVCAYLANLSRQNGREWGCFSWNPVIGHDNMQLNKIMERGISDNHYHLFGSSPAFKLIWIKLMNNLEDIEYIRALEKIDHHHMSVSKRYSDSGEEESFVRMRFKAALIRFYLNLYINSLEKRHKGLDDKILNEIHRILLQNDNGYQYYNELEIKIEAEKLQALMPQGKMVEDYACIGKLDSDINSEFAGERYLMYCMLKGNVNGIEIPHRLKNWFYAYLVIKVKFRHELLQANQKVGFDNFEYYSKRKNSFFNKDTDVESMITHAVGESFYTHNLRSLELRVSPQNTAALNQNFIEKCDECIVRYLGKMNSKNTYYVFHFPKKADGKHEINNNIQEMVCRHSGYREELERVSDEILLFRDLYPKQAQRVKGIDACSNELLCRPEVFGPIYRKLRGHIVKKQYTYVQQLKMTYHVGEEWYDIADGLRAIDEAILFLNMENGDRLGHATVLGIDIDDWYSKKKSEVWISYQEYLDNIAWIYNKLIEFDIKDCEAIKGYLESEFDQIYNKIFEPILKLEKFECSINLYYESWKLRGDDPSVYITGKYKKPVIFKWNYINSKIKNGNLIRATDSIVRLVYLYNYSPTIKERGSKILQKRVNNMYIECLKKIQNAMQYKIAQKGISIETNPSSNFKISTMTKYEQHPIRKFYNMGLTWEQKYLDNCPQIHASINTDDKGIFDTSLENEYALVGCSVEKLSYNRQYVYEWLDRIRENGNQQSFLDNKC